MRKRGMAAKRGFDYTMAFLARSHRKAEEGWSTKRIVVVCILGALRRARGRGHLYWSVSSNPMGGFDTALASWRAATAIKVPSSRSFSAARRSGPPSPLTC